MLMINEQKKADGRNSVKKSLEAREKRGHEKVKSNSLKTLVTRLGIYVHRDALRSERKLT